MHSVDAYRSCDQQQREQVLESVDVKLQTALQAARALRRRALDGQRI